ncbi:hypothetical protein [Pseudoduganella armeniaca]|uniref:hypothetical protein n=1 Tax=Pseudoduganella armeniaca TaxID=2072590 RepID=UPI0015E79ED2|nr:hypothetical protein [Pseudoduganella armeniaca]
MKNDDNNIGTPALLARAEPPAGVFVLDAQHRLLGLSAGLDKQLGTDAGLLAAALWPEPGAAAPAGWPMPSSRPRRPAWRWCRSSHRKARPAATWACWGGPAAPARASRNCWTTCRPVSSCTAPTA